MIRWFKENRINVALGLWLFFVILQAILLTLHPMYYPSEFLDWIFAGALAGACVVSPLVLLFPPD